MIKKTQSFLNKMMQYSTPSGIEMLENNLKNFAENAEAKIKNVIMEKVYQAQNYTTSHFDLPHALSLDPAQTSAPKGVPGEIFMTFKTMLDNLQSILPVVVDNMKFAKKEVSAVSKQLHSIFDTFKMKGPPIFANVSALYSTMWKAYY